LSFQGAVVLDASLSDSRSAASDWLNYGQFLQRQKQPERLAYACILRAERLMSATPGDELAVIVNARKESEARLGRAAPAVRNNAQTVSNEALSLSSSFFAPVR